MTTLAKALAAAGRDNVTPTGPKSSRPSSGTTSIRVVPFAPGHCRRVEAGMNRSGRCCRCCRQLGLPIFGLAADATVEDFAMAIGEQYGWSFSAMEKEVGNSDALSAMMTRTFYADYPTIGVKTVTPNISGIKEDRRLQHDRHPSIRSTRPAIYQLGVTIALPHYFMAIPPLRLRQQPVRLPQGRSELRACQDHQPLGAGPPKVPAVLRTALINLRPTTATILGAPKTKYLNFQQCMRMTTSSTASSPAPSILLTLLLQ